MTFIDSEEFSEEIQKDAVGNAKKVANLTVYDKGHDEQADNEIT